MAVEVEWAGLRRAYDAGMGGEFVWEFVGEVPGDPWVAVNEVVEEVNDIFDPEDGPGGVASSMVSRTFTGAAGEFMPAGYPEEVRGWFEESARRLVARGAAGRLAVVRSDPRPERLTREDVFPLSLIVGLPLSSESSVSTAGRWAPHRGWGPAAALASRVIDAAAAWLMPERGRVFVHREFVTEEVSGKVDLREVLLVARQECVVVSASWTSRDGAEARRIDLGQNGLLVAKALGPRRRDDDNLGVLLDLARSVGPDADVASVRRARIGAHNWESASQVAPPPPHAGGQQINGSVDATFVASIFDQRPALRPSGVVDAYVAQVLTDQHLTSLESDARWDISDWSVEPLANGRHLVAARARWQWINDVAPREEALAQAREAMAIIILDPRHAYSAP